MDARLCTSTAKAVHDRRLPVRPHGFDECDFSRPEPLFTFGAGMEQGIDRDFDVTNDGERFLFLVAEGGAAGDSTVELVLVQNWVQELERLVPRER